MEKLKSSKIFKLKKFLTLPEAAQRLSVGLGEEVKETDILQFALEGHLILSVNFVNTTYGIHGRHINNEPNKVIASLLRMMPYLGLGVTPLPGLSEAETIEKQKLINTLLDNSKTPNLRGDTLLHSDGSYYEFHDKALILHGAYDLPMIDGERIDINRRYQKLENGVDVTLPACDGVFVRDDEGFLFKLVEAVDNEPLEKIDSIPILPIYKLATELPKNSVLLVRTQALLEFESLLDEEDVTKNKTEANSSIEPNGHAERHAKNREQGNRSDP